MAIKTPVDNGLKRKEDYHGKSAENNVKHAQVHLHELSQLFLCLQDQIDAIECHGPHQGIDKTDNLEGMYCAYEKSRCIEEEKGCVCGKCALTAEYGLDKMYYCTVTDGK